MPELDGKKRIIDYETVINPDENYYVPVDNGTEGTGKVSVKMVGPSDMISDAYDATSTYKVGDLCIYNNKLYVCTVDIDTPHAFDLSEWDPDTLGNYVSEIKSSLSDLNVEFENFSLGNFLGYVFRMGNLRIITLYNGTDTQTAISADLNPKDYPTQDFRVGSWTQINSSGNWGTRYLQVSASTHKISTSDTVYRGGFTLVYKV